MPHVDPPVHLFMSARAADRFGARIGQVLSGVPYVLEALETIAARPGESPAHIGFLTRDVVADAGSGTSPALARFIDVTRRAPRLAWVHSNSAGSDRPIMRELLDRGVVVTTSSGATAPAVALTAFGGLLALARKFDVAFAARQRKAWEPLLGERAPDDLAGQSVVIVGLGPIGREIARLADAVGMRVVGVRRTGTPCPPAERVVAYADLPAVLPEARWLVLACPLTDTTRRLVDAALLARLPRGAHVINVSRGGVVVDADLLAALASGHLASAFVDVFEQEPLPQASPFWTLPNVIVHPHSAAHTTGAYDRVGELFLDNLARWRDGRPLLNDLSSRGAPSS